jgi:outer membrane protein assembly factor BamB
MFWKKKTVGSLAACAMSLAMLPVASAQTYKVLKQYSLPGTTAHGVAVDAVARLVLVASDEGVTVLNADTGAVVGTVPLKNAQDVLLVPAENGEEPAASTMAFATGDGTVVAFALDGLKVKATEKLPTAGSSSLCYDDEEKTVEVVSAGGSLGTADAETGKLKRTAHVPTGAGQIACGTLNHVYVADTAGNVIHVLNHATGKNDGDYPIMTGNKPSGLTLDTKGRRLFVGCEDGTIEVIDTDSGFTFIELKAGQGRARETFAWTPQGKGGWKAAAFIAQPDGQLTAVKMNAYINYTVGGTYKLPAGLGRVAYDAKTHHLLIADTQAGKSLLLVVGN